MNGLFNYFLYSSSCKLVLVLKLLKEIVHFWKFIPFSLLAANGLLPSLNTKFVITKYY